MIKRRSSFRFILFFAAATALSVCLLCSAPKVQAESAAVTVTGSDALMAALSDAQCSEIVLSPSTVYYVDQPVSIDRQLTLTGGGSVIEFSEGAAMGVGVSGSLRLNDVTVTSTKDHSIRVSGMITLGDKVIFDGDRGIYLASGSTLTSSGASVAASDKLASLITAAPSGGVILIQDARLNQAQGDAAILEITGGTGKISFKGSVELMAANGTAVYCAAASDGPDVTLEDGSTLSVTASRSTIDQNSNIPGAAMYIRSCAFTMGTGSKLGVTGSYCGVAAKTVTIGKDCVITAQCDNKSTDSFSCAALSATGKLTCATGTRITVGSSGSNSGSGLYGGQIELDSNVSVICRSINSNSAAIASGGAVEMKANSSLSSNGGGYGIRCGSLTASEKITVDINGAAIDGIYSSGAVNFGTSATVDIAAGRCAVYSKGAVIMSADSRISLSSAGDGAALWLDSQVDNLLVNGCQLTVSNSSSAKAEKKAAVYCSGGVTVDRNSEVTIINNGDFALIAAGGSLNVTGSSVMRCSGSIGILLSSGSLLVSDNSLLCAEGTVDSAVRVERGSFSVTGGGSVDIQGSRFGVETISGDFYIDGASAFDIRSTIDRAVYVTNGRMVIQNIDRISVWDRHPEQKNSLLWWKNKTNEKYSWEAPGADKTNWHYASHTALQPNISQQYVNGTPQPSAFSWYDGAWLPADYSRLGMYVSRPVGRANSYNIPAGKSFSWILFGQSYDDYLRFSLTGSTGDGEFELLENGAFTYTAFDYTRGLQTFDFIVENSDGVTSEPVTISVFVTASKPPIASSATLPTNTYDPYIGQVNVVDYDGNIASIKVVEQPQNGMLVLNSDGRFSYQPEPGFVGIDSFSYYAVDNMGDESNTARITLPVCMIEETVVCNSTIITESSTPGGVRLEALLGEETVAPAPQFVITSPPVYGVIEFDETEPDLISYIPYKDFSGTDSFTFAAVREDGSLTADGFVSIATIPSQRPAANGGAFYCTKNSSCDGRLSGYDVDGQITFFTLVNSPENGRIELDGVTGEFKYYAERGFAGTDSFSYTVTDSDGLISDPVEVTITVSSLLDNLRETGRLGATVVLICLVLVCVGGFIALIAVSAARRRREEENEKAKSRLFDFGGSGQRNRFDYYDNYSDYDDYNN